ncbi:spermidine synthase [Paenibacillus sp. sptzw28]|uniref:spermine/spermidine synthase domain-containing protein n=1 Tax=Paenibacillus sp. sptzw28 TaxID=715179 RepID=UPI001C6E34DA|nr:spermidine synthase [Paenibacillus sp. sptzw28]QYR23306.1 spermidine synthase [Paenibacillus sp. sptzw28]
MTYKKAQVISRKSNNTPLTKPRALSLRDYISKDDEPDGKYKILLRMKTPYQRIAVVELKNGKVLVYGDGYVMFGTTGDDNIWAESLVHIPMAAAKKQQNVLMIGGGGGITTREVLRYRGVNTVTVVDIDSKMLDLGRNLKQLVKFNKGSLSNAKVKTVIRDGRAFVEKSQMKWDVIIIDVPEPSHDSPGLSRLYSREFFTLLKNRLTTGGVISIACSMISEMPEFCWSVIATIKAAGLYVLPYHYDARKKYGEDWCFCAASNKPLASSDLNIKISTRYLTSSKLKSMFQFSSKYRRKWSRRKIQTDNNKVLADIHERY